MPQAVLRCEQFGQTSEAPESIGSGEQCTPSLYMTSPLRLAARMHENPLSPEGTSTGDSWALFPLFYPLLPDEMPMLTLHIPSVWGSPGMNLEPSAEMNGSRFPWRRDSERDVWYWVIA